MKVFLIIVLVLILLPVAFFIFALIANIFLLATGRMTKEELSVKVKAYKEQKRNEKKNKAHGLTSLDYLSYPSPLNSWGLWH
ncbi:MAG: hypothetical protein MJ003_04755 [Paludibacteraceae bacterium]|nr:hypothetical protein [Paludibacteraceae bacterium]